MISFFIALLIVFAIVAFVLMIQGVVTQLAAWLVTGKRPELAQVVRANVLSGIAGALALLVMLFQIPWLQSLMLPFSGLVALMIVVPLLVTSWVFAQTLKIKFFHAATIIALVNLLNLGIGFLSKPLVPDIPADVPIPQDLRQFI
jgi:hypothetical protein